MSVIHETYVECCNEEKSDINEHLPTLKKYAEDCEHITECGVRGCKSSYAFAEGLRGRPSTKLIQYDIQYNVAMGPFLDKCKTDNITLKKEACIAQGYNYEIWCFNRKGEIIDLDNIN